MTLSSVFTYQRYVREGTKLAQKFEATVAVAKEADYFERALAKVNSVEQLFNDRRAVKFLAKALNLSGEEQYPGKMRRILSEKVSDKNAIMNRLPDKRYAQAAEQLRLGETGLERLKTPITTAYLKSKYKQALFEDSIGQENLAVRQARYFESYAGSANNPYSILGDPILREVVTSTLGLPLRIAIQPVETQAKAITDRVDVKKFSDPKFRESFIKRFLNQYDLKKTGSDTTGNWQLALLSAGTSTGGTGVNMMV